MYRKKLAGKFQFCLFREKTIMNFSLFFITKFNMVSEVDINRIIEMAWEDRTPFEVIQSEFDLTHGELVNLMRNNLKPRSFRLWRKRVTGRKTKHIKLRGHLVGRHRCDRQGKLNIKKR